MKTIKYLLALSAIICFLAVYAQGEFTITEQETFGDLVLIKIEHNNGKCAEYLVKGHEEEIFLSQFGSRSMVPDENGGFPANYLIKNINLPSEDYSSTPVQFFDAGSKIYCYGTKEVMILDASTGDITNTIPLLNTGNYTNTVYLPRFPVHKLIAGSATNQRLYVADLINNLYFINTAYDQIEVIHSETSLPDQISTSVVYNEYYGLVYWLINSWAGTGGTLINVYDAGSGDYITQRIFDDQINDITVIDGIVYIIQRKVNHNGDFLYQLDPEDLTTTNTLASTNQFFKFLEISEYEIGLAGWNPQNLTGMLKIVKPSNLTVTQNIVPSFDTYRLQDLKTETSSSFILLDWTGSGDSFTFRYQKDQSGSYLQVSALVLNSVFLTKLSDIVYDSLLYIGGNDNLLRLNLQNFTFTADSHIKGCLSTDILAKEFNSILNIYSTNPYEGTISRHYGDCSIDLIQQTSFKTNIACFNHSENKAYSLNNRIDYEESGLAVINTVTNKLSKIIALGKQLTDVVYNANSNKVFVSGKAGNEVFIVCGVTDQLLHTITLPAAPIRLLSYQNKVLCGTNNAIYVVDADNYSYSTINLPFYGDFLEYCKAFISVDDFNSIYALYTYEGKTYVVDISNISFTLNDVHQFNYPHGQAIGYNPKNQEVYIVNALLPKLHIYDPVDFSLLNTITVLNNATVYHLDMSVNPFRNQVYITYYNRGPGKNQLSIVDVNTNTVTTSELNAAMGAHHYNMINDYLYFNDIVLNQNGRHEIAFGVNDCMDHTGLPDVNAEMFINRPFSFITMDNNIRPAFNHINNQLLIPNGDFSNISVIQAYHDILPLQNGWNWKSFPRMERYGNDYHNSIQVLEQINYFPLELHMHHLDHTNYIAYDGYDWVGDLENIKSTKGYKLYFDLTEGPAPEILLLGARLNPDTMITLYPFTENWIGYFIQEPQWPWDAFPPDVYDNYLTSIQTQYWTMVKMFGAWQIPKIVTPLKYGDLVIVTIEGQAPVSFAWNNPAAGEEEMEAFKTSYYTYEEESDYLPVFIEKDPLDDFLEIAVLANGEVRGASVVFENDSLVQICAYLQGVPPGTPLEFETWSGTKSSRVDAGNYLVRNRNTGIFERRIAYAGENAPFHFISLKSGPEDDKPDQDQFSLSVYPNPLLANTVFAFSIHEEADIKLNIFDMYGKLISNPVSGKFPPGSYRIAWDASDDEGQSLSGGVYFYRFTTGNGLETSGRVIVIR